MELYETNPGYILSRPERYSKETIKRAQQTIKDRRNAEKKTKKAQYKPCDLAQLIIAIRKCKSGSKKEQELKTQIESVTGQEYFV